VNWNNSPKGTSPRRDFQWRMGKHLGTNSIFLSQENLSWERVGPYN